MSAHVANGEQTFTMSVTLPNLNCDKCTLQVIEFMAGHGFNFSYAARYGPRPAAAISITTARS